MAFPFTRASRHPFGSARFAEPKELARAGLLTRTPHSLFMGFYGRSPVWYSGMGGAICVAGPRSGKLRDLIGWNLCAGMYSGSLLILDIKNGELASVSQWQVPARKHCIYWNPGQVGGLAYHRINPVAFIHADSRSLVSDVKIFAENVIVATGSPQSAFFENRAREVVEALVLALVKRDRVLTLPALFEAINLMVIGGEEWLDLAFEMAESGFDSAERIEQEIAKGRDDSSGGFLGILGEITQAFACLSDPMLLASVSPPFDFCLSQLCASDQTYNVYLMPPSEFVEAWAAVIKTFFVAARTYKVRTPSSPRQTWILDECGNLGGFPLVIKLFTRDAGLGIRPWAFFQSTKQMNALAKDGEQLLMASGAFRSYFGIRDEATANSVSAMMGSQTLAYLDPRQHEIARHGAARAAQELLGRGNPVMAALELVHRRKMASMPLLKERRLMTPDELLGLAPDKQIIFADGLAHPVYADRRAYYDEPALAGLYHPNPNFPPETYVRIATARGYVWRPVIREKVPEAYAHYPQYTDGFWSRIG